MPPADLDVVNSLGHVGPIATYGAVAYLDPIFAVCRSEDVVLEPYSTDLTPRATICARVVAYRFHPAQTWHT